MVVALDEALLGQLVLPDDFQQLGGYGFVQDVLLHRPELAAPSLCLVVLVVYVFAAVVAVLPAVPVIGCLVEGSSAVAAEAHPEQERCPEPDARLRPHARVKRGLHLEPQFVVDKRLAANELPVRPHYPHRGPGGLGGVVHYVATYLLGPQETYNLRPR